MTPRQPPVSWPPHSGYCTSGTRHARSDSASPEARDGTQPEGGSPRSPSACARPRRRRLPRRPQRLQRRAADTHAARQPRRTNPADRRQAVRARGLHLDCGSTDATASATYPRTRAPRSTASSHRRPPRSADLTPRERRRRLPGRRPMTSGRSQTTADACTSTYSERFPTATADARVGPRSPPARRSPPASLRTSRHSHGPLLPAPWNTPRGNAPTRCSLGFCTR